MNKAPLATALLVMATFVTALFVTVMLSANCFAQDAKSLPTTASPDQRVFADRCLKCHGDGGTGTFMLSRRVGKDKALLADRTDLSADYVRHVVRNGIVSMPALTRVEVTDEELKAIVRYLTRTRTAN